MQASIVTMISPISIISKDGNRTLMRLIWNRVLVISKADKGDSTVIMTMKQDLELAYKHLNEDICQLLNIDPAPHIAGETKETAQ